MSSRAGAAGRGGVVMLVLLSAAGAGLIYLLSIRERDAVQQVAQVESQQELSSEVLKELALADPRIARRISMGDTNIDWTVGQKPPDDDEPDDAPVTPDFVEKSRQVPAPGAGTRHGNIAAGSRTNTNDVASANSPGAQKATGTSATVRVSSRSSRSGKENGVEDIAAKLKKIEQMPWSPEAAQMLNETLAQWAKLDPKAALDYAMSLDSRRARVNAVNSVISAWAKTDPAGAVNWYLQNMPSDPRAAEATIQRLFTGLAAGDRNAALQSIAMLPTPEQQRLAMRTVADYVARTGESEDLATFYQGITDPTMKNLFAVSMAQTWAAYQPSVAATWLGKVTDPAILKQAVPSLVYTWGFDDPAAATQWAASLPVGGTRSSAVQSGTLMWAKDDPVAAADWVMTLQPPNKAADPAIQGLVSAIKRSYPEGAMMWASSLSDPVQQQRAMQDVAQVWMKQDPAKASVYIQQSSLPVKVKNQLLKIK